MTAPAVDAGTDARRTLIAATLAGKFRWLRFRAPLESGFRAAYARGSIAVVQRVLPWITLMYAGIGFAMHGTTSTAAYALWKTNAMWPVLAVLVALWLSAYGGLLRHRVHLQVGIAMLVAIAATARTVFLLGDDPAAVFVSYQTIYLLTITGTTLRLRFFPAIGWMLAAAALAIAAALLADIDVHWLAFAQYALAPGLMAAVIAYVMEYRDRADWLRTQRRDLEMRDMEAMRTRHEAEHRRHKLVGDYLARVAGNLTPTEIAGRTLAFLIEHADAQVGAVFLTDGERLRRAAASGLDGELRLPEDLGRGETLIGQAAQNRRRLRLTHLPEGYNAIRTATGTATPGELLLEPVHHEGNTLAVIELGRLQPFADDAVELVDQLAPAMAGALVAAQARDALARAGIDDFTL